MTAVSMNEPALVKKSIPDIFSDQFRSMATLKAIARYFHFKTWRDFKIQAAQNGMEMKKVVPGEHVTTTVKRRSRAWAYLVIPVPFAAIASVPFQGK